MVSKKRSISDKDLNKGQGGTARSRSDLCSDNINSDVVVDNGEGLLWWEHSTPDQPGNLCPPNLTDNFSDNGNNLNISSKPYDNNFM